MLNHFYCSKAGWMYVMSEATCIHVQIFMTDDNLLESDSLYLLGM